MASESVDVFEPDGYLAGQVRRTSRNLLVWNGAVLLLLLGVMAALHNYFRGFFQGPIPYDDQKVLAAAADPNTPLQLIDRVDLGQRQLRATGWKEVMTIDNRPHSSYPYFYTTVGNKLLLVKGEGSPGARQLLGNLYKIPADVERDVIGGLEAKHPQLRGQFLPVMVDSAAAFRTFGYVFFALFGPIALVCIWNILSGLRRIGRPERHPLMKQLRPFGDLTAVAAAVDREIARGTADSIGPVFVTPSLLLWPRKFTVAIMRLQDVVWMYHHNLASHGVHSAIFHLRTKKITGVVLRKQLVSELLAAVTARVPWSIVGYNVELGKTWRKDPDAVIAMADARRQQAEQQRTT
jgi:hypothetical protein